MKNIEERAEEFAMKVFSCSPYLEITREIYIKIATEQKAIDIDKACDWLKARNVLTEASIEGFRKALEE